MDPGSDSEQSLHLELETQAEEESGLTSKPCLSDVLDTQSLCLQLDTQDTPETMPSESHLLLYRLLS